MLWACKLLLRGVELRQNREGDRLELWTAVEDRLDLVAVVVEPFTLVTFFEALDVEMGDVFKKILVFEDRLEDCSWRVASIIFIVRDDSQAEGYEAR